MMPGLIVSIGDSMARTPRNIGPETLALIEAAPVSFIRELVLRRETDSEPALDAHLPAGESSDSDGFRMALIAALDAEHPENLLPMEDRCRRIRRLADGKGPASLDILVVQQLSHDENMAYGDQLDELCRSAWSFLNHRLTFEDAEAFHAARQYRDYGQMYDAFEVDVEDASAIDAVAVDEEALAARIAKLLDLSSKCSIRAINLPKTASHPASLMLIVRHPGPLSSVFSHKTNGLKGTIYYRPSNEATLIWTPQTRQMEICAHSPDVRQKVGVGFAEVVLQQDMSRKPLTWRRYDLSRFRTSLSLDIPEHEGCEIQAVQLIEIELRLGTWSRRLALKVSIEDDIETIAKRYLGASDVFRRAEGFSRISIAVKYVELGSRKPRSLNMQIGNNRSNLQSKRDPDERALGYALLDHWGILNAFRQLDDDEARSNLPQLLELHDLPESEVTGRYLQERGLDVRRLIKAGIIDLRGRQNVILIDDDEDFGEVSLEPSGQDDAVQATGLHGQNLGTRSTEDILRYALKRDWLEETILKLIKPAVTRPSITSLDEDLVCLGRMKLDAAEVPLYLARRLEIPGTTRRLDLILRGRQELGIGIVLAAGATPFHYLGPNVVVRILDHLADDVALLSKDSVAQAFLGGRHMALGGASIALLKSSTQSATLHIPGKPSLAILGANQIKIFERLVAAHVAGSPDVKASALTEGCEVQSPQQAFRMETWKSILNVYLGQGAKRGFWRLIVDVPLSDQAV
jgi:hypothetical protein